jgi:hypothetical protein
MIGESEALSLQLLGMPSALDHHIAAPSNKKLIEPSAAAAFRQAVVSITSASIYTQLWPDTIAVNYST